METRKRVLGERYPDTLTSINNLSFTWMVQGRYADALALMKEWAQARKQVLGPEYPSTLASLIAVAKRSSQNSSVRRNPSKYRRVSHTYTHTLTGF